MDILCKFPDADMSPLIFCMHRQKVIFVEQRVPFVAQAEGKGESVTRVCIGTTPHEEKRKEEEDATGWTSFVNHRVGRLSIVQG